MEAPSLTHQRQADIVSDLEMLAPLVIYTDPMQCNEVRGRLTQAHPSAASHRRHGKLHPSGPEKGSVTAEAPVTIP